MPDYKQGKIYAIYSPNYNGVYIGSTTQKLSTRMAEHRSGYKRWKEGKRNKTSSFDIIEAGGAYIELIENYPCNDVYELQRREGEIMREKTASINQAIAGRSIKQWYIDNKEKVSEQQKQYRETNKQQIAGRNKQWYIDNKQQIQQRRKQIITCECGSVIKYYCKSRHLRTLKHQQFLKQ